MNLSLSRAFGRRVLAASTVLGTALLLVTCTGEPVAPGAPRLGQVSVAPIWPEASRLGGLVLDNVRLTVVRLPADTLARVARPFAPTTTQLQLTVPVLLLGPSENLQVTLDLLSGPTLLFSGTQLLTVGAGGGGSPIPIPVAYACPPIDCPPVASLTLQPRDTTITAGSAVSFRVTAVDAQAQAVTQFYTTWSSSSAAVTIDGAGVATAGAGRATVTITAVTPLTGQPNGVRDSTTLTVVPPATQLVKISGDNQSAGILSPLPLPLVVEVRAADNLPVAGATVTFAALSGGGSVDSATATTDAAGRATSGATLGATAGAQSFTATASGTNSVTFSATATSGGVKTWTGAVSTDWSTAGNWTPAAVPTAGDSVAVIAGTPNDPTLTGNATMRALALQGTNAALTVAGTLTVSGSVALPDTNSFIDFTSGQLAAGSVTLAGFQAFIDVSLGSASISGPITLSGDRAFFEGGPGSALGAATLSGNQAFLSHYGGTQGPVTASGSSAFWEATGAVTVTGTPAIQLGGTAFLSSFGAPAQVTINGDVTVGGTAAFFDISGGDHWTINGTLQTTGGGVLRMNQVTDTLEVNGNVSFGGGDESTQLTAGQLFVSGNFSQTGLATSFVGSGTHLVFLDGSGSQTLNFASPGFAASRFQNVIIANSAGGVTVTSDVVATGTVGVTPTAVRTLSGNGSTLFTTILNVSNFTFTNLLLNFTGSTVVTFDTVTFQGYAPTATPLTIVHPGAAAPLPFQDIVFTVTPSTGFYLDATDSNPSDGVPLVIDMLNPTPASPGTRVQTAGGATVNWTGVGPIIWTGAVSTDWNTAGNWSTGAVPTNADDVVIPSGGNQPTVTTSCSAKSLTVNVGATLDLGSNNCQVLGNVFADGAITGIGALQISAALASVRGTLPNLQVSSAVNATGPVTLTGSLTVTGLTGSFGAGGQTVAIAGLLTTQSGGLLVMTLPADVVTVGSSATFSGGNELGFLTAGTLTIAGNFTQVGGGSGSNDSFHPSGTHLTVFTGASPTLNFGTPGNVPGSSHFEQFRWTGTGTMTLASNVFAHGTMDGSPGVSGTITSAGLTLQVGSLVGGGLTLNNTRLILDGSAGGPLALDNVSFIGLPSTATQLTVNHPGTGGPFSFSNLSFSPVPTTGFYLSATDLNGAINGFLTLNLVNPNPATPGAFVQPAGGAVINWPAASPVKTWTGASTSDWQTSGNWSPAGVPVATDDVTIPAVATQPVMSAAVSIRNLTVQSGALLNLNSFALNVSGDLSAPSATSFISGGGTLNLLGTARTIGGTLSSALPVNVSGTYALAGRTVIGGLTVSGSGDVNANGQTLVVSAALNTVGSGTITMTNPLDSVLVTGAGIFGGGFTGGKLTAGYLKIGGSFTQTSGTTSGSFVASGTHKTELGAAAVRIVNFASPGFGTGTSQFNDLIVTGATGGLSLASNTFLNGQLIARPTGATPLIGVTAGPKVLTVGGVDVSRLTIDQNVMTIGAGTITQFDTVSFTGQANGVTQLTIDHPGAATPFNFTALSFGVTPVGGLYLAANDVDGATSGVLTINMVSASPAAPSTSLFSATGGAVVNWPPAAPVITWTGSISTDWSVAGNWSPAQVPTSANGVVIPAFLPVATVTSSCAAKSLTVSGQMSLGTNDCQVQGTVASNGVIVGTTGAVVIQGAGQINGNFPNLVISAPVTVANATGLGGGNGNLTITGAGASLTMNGQTLVMPGNLSVQGGGVLVMNNPADVLTVQGSAAFDGGNESGLLTAGTLTLAGNFTQAATSSGTSFLASGSHRTVFVGTGSTVSFATPASSHFQELDVTPVNGAVTLNSDVTVAGQLISVQSSANGPTVDANGAFTLTAGGADIGAPQGINALTFDAVPLVLSGGTITDLSNVLFANQSPVGTALTVNNVGQGTAYTFSNLTFTSTLSAGGFHLVANDLDGATPDVLVIDMIGASPASGAGVSQATNGAVINWPPTGNVFTWDGSADNNWSNPANWDRNAVPGVIDDVVLVPITNQPVLTTNVGINNLTSTAGSILDLSGFVLAVGGFADLAGTINDGVGGGGVTLAGSGGQLLQGTMNTTVLVGGSYLMNGNLTVGGDLAVNGTLDLGGFTATVSGIFSTINNGVVVMTNPTSFLDVTGDALFAGGNTTGLLTAGTLRIGGVFDQLGINSAQSFAAIPGHLTELSANPASITFTTPGINGSHFGDLRGSIFNVQLQLNSDATILGFLDSGDGFGGSFLGSSCPVTLTMTQWNSSAVLDCVQLVIDDPAGVSTGMSSVTFLNLPTTVTQLAIRHPGVAAGNFGTGTLDFVPLSGGDTGHYLDVTDLDGNPPFLVVDIFGSNVFNGPSFTTTSGGASVIWQNATLTWTGAVDNDWNTAGNWDLGFVPSSQDSVVIPATVNQPTLVNFNGFAGAVTVTAGTVDLNGRTLNVTRNFTTTGTGTLTMNSAFSTLFVGGDATFGGGSTIGLLTAGEVVVSGNFSQVGTNSATSYASSGSHRTSMSSTAPTALVLGTPGAGGTGSHFALLNLSAATGGVTLGSNVLVENTLESNNTSARIVGGGNSVTSKAWSVTGLTVDNAPMILDDQGSAALAIFDNVTFQNFPQNGVTQLRLNVAGSSLTVRPITFNNTVFSHLTAGTSLYVNATNSAIGGYVLTLQGSSEGAIAGGNGPSFSTFSGGATLSWP